MAPVYLLILFVTVPLAEIYVLIEVGSVVGALPTIGLCLFTAALGSLLIRLQGVATLGRVQRSLEARELPAVPLLEGLFLLIAGLMLLTPGFVTDLVGFACLVPPLRQALILAWLEPRIRRMKEQADGPQGQRVLEGEFRREDRD
jgi:UPF0716 protein FxsA